MPSSLERESALVTSPDPAIAQRQRMLHEKILSALGSGLNVSRDVAGFAFIETGKTAGWAGNTIVRSVSGLLQSLFHRPHAKQ